MVRASLPHHRACGTSRGSRRREREVSVDGTIWCDYHFAAYPIRSYLHLVIGPYGVRMTRAWPLQEGVPGEETDHVHHRSVWVRTGW